MSKTSFLNNNERLSTGSSPRDSLDKPSERRNSTSQNPMLAIGTSSIRDSTSSNVAVSDELSSRAQLSPTSLFPPDLPMRVRPSSPAPSVHSVHTIRSVRSVHSVNSTHSANSTSTKSVHNPNVFVKAEAQTPQNKAQVSFTMFFIYVFIVGMVIGLFVLIAEMVLIGQQVIRLQNMNLSVSDQDTAFWVANLIITFWNVFGLFFICSFAPARIFIDVACLLALVAGPLLAVWGYYFFVDPVACVAFLIPGLGVLPVPFGASKHVYELLALLPDDDKTIDVWTTCWRYFAIAIIPIISNFIATRQNSAVFFTALILSIALSMICVNFRIQAALRPSAPTSTIVLTTLLPRSLALAYGPPFGMLLVFAVLYITQISSLQVPQIFFTVVLVLAALLIFMYSLIAFAFLTRYSSLNWFNPLTSENYRILEAAHLRAKAFSQFSMTIRVEEDLKRRQRDEQAKLLFDVEARIDELRPGLSIINFMVYMFIIGIILLIPMLIVEVYWFSSNSNKLQNRPVWIYNLLASSWTSFGSIFCVSYAPSPFILNLMALVTAIFCALMSVWAYSRLGIIGMLFYIFMALTSLNILPMSNLIFKKFSSLPVEDATLAIWFAGWRFFGIVTVPIVAYFAQLDQEQGVSFLVIIIFVLLTSFFCTTVRLGFSFKRNAPSSAAGLLKQFTISQLLMSMIPLITLGVVFMVLYIIALVGFSLDLLNPSSVVQSPETTLETVLLAVALFMLMSFMLYSYVYLSDNKYFKFLLPFTEHDMDNLDLSKEKAAAMREMMLKFDDPIKELEKQRSHLQNMLAEIDTELDRVYGTIWAQDWEVTKVLVYAFFVANVFIVIVNAVIVALVYAQIYPANLTGFFIFNMIAVGILPLFLIFCLMYAPSAVIARMSALTVTVGLCLIGAWGLAPGNVPFDHAFALLVFSALFILGLAIVAKKIYERLSVLPIEDSTLQVWFTAIRFFFVLAIRLVQLRLVQDSGASQFKSSQASFLAIGFYVAAISCLCTHARVAFTIDPFARNVPALFRHQSLRGMQRYVNMFGLFILFVIYFVIEIAGFGGSIQGWLNDVFITIALIFMSLFVLNVAILLLRLRIFHLSFFGPYSDEEFAILDAALVKLRPQDTEMVISTTTIMILPESS